MVITGTDLKVERVRARVSIVDLAAQMRVSRATVWIIERSEVVPPARIDDYRQALARVRDVTTSEGVA